jgi:hypothetical protein
MFIKFKELSIGDTFDFINDEEPHLNSFFARCTKTGPRTYSAGQRQYIYKVRTVHVAVFHVEYAPIQL